MIDPKKLLGRTGTAKLLRLFKIEAEKRVKKPVNGHQQGLALQSTGSRENVWAEYMNWDLVFPVGSVIIMAEQHNECPIPIGKWQRTAVGRAIFGVGDLDDNTTQKWGDTAEEDRTMFSNPHERAGTVFWEIPYNEIPKHKHKLNIVGDGRHYCDTTKGFTFQKVRLRSDENSQYEFPITYIDETEPNYSEISGVSKIWKYDDEGEIVSYPKTHHHTVRADRTSDYLSGAHNNLEPFQLVDFWERIE